MTNTIQNIIQNSKSRVNAFDKIAKYIMDSEDTGTFYNIDWSFEFLSYETYLAGVFCNNGVKYHITLTMDYNDNMEQFFDIEIYNADTSQVDCLIFKEVHQVIMFIQELDNGITG